MNKYLFVPDLYKFEEEFESEGENCIDAIKKVEEIMCLNVSLSVFKRMSYGLQLVGVVTLFEGKIEFFKPVRDVGLVRSEPR